jgi:hypothetical protein
MESRGYPVDYKKAVNFSKQVLNIIYDCQKDINRLFPEILPFKWDKKNGRYRWDQAVTREWVIKNHLGFDWIRTDTGNHSLSLEAFEKYYSFDHTYPEDNFGAQMVRYLKLKQHLYGFVPAADKTKKTFWSFVGPDQRVRPYSNHFGAQSSRSQQSSTGFLFLKSAWIRALCHPKEGYAMAGVDYGSEEFYIQALLSEDQDMIEAYQSGDVYLAFAKDAGMVPADGTKEEYKEERDICKSTVLGIGYNMTKVGLAIKLTNDTGKVWDEYDAQKMIDLFKESYPVFTDYQEQIQGEYVLNGYSRLADGWYMWGNNDNFRSVGNFPIQGMGAVIMRKAVDMAVERGCYIPFTLHDALYVEYKVGEEEKVGILMDCMKEAFAYYFPTQKEEALKIKLDPFAWSSNYKKDSSFKLKDGRKIPCSNLYIDERSLVEYTNFSKYFEDREENLL